MSDNITSQEFMEHVQRTAKEITNSAGYTGQMLDTLHWSMGLAGEVGEVVDPIKKAIFYRKELDLDNIKEEIGDIFYYLYALSHTLGIDVDEAKRSVVSKLQKRYPTGYNNYHAGMRMDKLGEK